MEENKEHIDNAEQAEAKPKKMTRAEKKQAKAEAAKAKKAEKRAKQPEKGTKKSILLDLAKLGMKIVLVVAAFAAIFTFVFGLARIDTNYMVPSVRDGDLVMYYRLDQFYGNEDLAALKYEGSDIVGRVVAREGDEVDIDAQGLKVNGNYLHEQGIYFDTTQVVDGVTFPLTVPAHSVFLLGDNRPEAVDSRIYGCVNIDNLEGKVIMILRRRSF